MHFRSLVAPFLFLVPTALAVAGCGHSEEEWQAQLDKYAKLENDKKASEAKLSAQIDEAKSKIDQLTKDLEQAGVDVSKLNANLSAANSTLAEQEKALAEYKPRAAQLEAIKQRFEALRKKLDELTKLGLAVNIRRNRMVISLPGDVLFDSGRETLKKEGQDILRKVATVIQGDNSLKGRDY